MTNPVAGPSRSLTVEEQVLTVWKCPIHGVVLYPRHAPLPDAPDRHLCADLWCGHEDLEETEYLPRSLHDAEVGRLEETLAFVRACLPDDHRKAGQPCGEDACWLCAAETRIDEALSGWDAKVKALSTHD